jgi:transaldolase
MKIFAATGDIGEIQWAEQAALIDGVLLPADFSGNVGYLCDGTALPVCVNVTALDPREMVGTARALAREYGDQVSVQVPFYEDALSAVRRLRDDGVRVVAALITTVAQAVLAAKAGASMVSIDVGELDRRGRDGADVIREARALFTQHGTSCDVLAVSARDAQQFSRCARAGADIVGVAPDLLHELLVRAAS